jgi:hypothetical protein
MKTYFTQVSILLLSLLLLALLPANSLAQEPPAVPFRITTHSSNPCNMPIPGWVFRDCSHDLLWVFVENVNLSSAGHLFVRADYRNEQTQVQETVSKLEPKQGDGSWTVVLFFLPPGASNIRVTVVPVTKLSERVVLVPHVE